MIDIEIEIVDSDQELLEYMDIDVKTLIKTMNSDYDCDYLDFEDGYHIEYDMGLS